MASLRVLRFLTVYEINPIVTTVLKTYEKYTARYSPHFHGYYDTTGA